MPDWYRFLFEEKVPVLGQDVQVEDLTAGRFGPLDLVIVVGSRNSSNSNRLREVAENLGVPAKLVDGGADIDPAWVAGKVGVGVTAGASAPEVLVDEVVARLRALGADEVRRLDGAAENVNFPLPRELATDGD